MDNILKIYARQKLIKTRGRKLVSIVGIEFGLLSCFLPLHLGLGLRQRRPRDRRIPYFHLRPTESILTLRAERWRASLRRIRSEKQYVVRLRLMHAARYDI